MAPNHRIFSVDTVRIKITIKPSWIFRFHRRPIQIVVFFTVGLGLYHDNFNRSCWMSNFLVSWLGQLTIGVQITDEWNMIFKSTVCLLQAATKEGFLMKQTWSFQRWRRRYFKLKGHKLYYAKDTKVSAVLCLSRELMLFLLILPCFTRLVFCWPTGNYWNDFFSPRKTVRLYKNGYCWYVVHLDLAF